jgi:N-acetylmuramoyl-L-alanine amidase
MKWSPGADDIFINNVKFCLSFPIEDRNGEAMVSRVDLAKLLHPIIRPSHIQNAAPFNTVVIDAGHGGEDSGAVGPYGSEKNYTLDTAFRLKKRLEAAGYKTVLTRSTDVFITRPGRVAIANKYPTAIFVSIHFNSFGSSAAGLETFALAPAGTANTDKALKESDFSMRRGNERDSENIALATAVHANCLARLRGIDRGVKRDRFDVLTGILRPGILVEGGFVSNPAEGAKIHRPEYRENLAEAILGGIQNYRKALLRGRSGGSTRVPLRAGVAGSPPPESKPIPIPPKSEKPPASPPKKESPKPTPKEDPKSSKSPAPKEEPKPAEAPKPKEDAKPSEAPKEDPSPQTALPQRKHPNPPTAQLPKEKTQTRRRPNSQRRAQAGRWSSSQRKNPNPPRLNAQGRH